MGLDRIEVFAVFVSLCANPEALGRARQWVRSEASKAKDTQPTENALGRVAGQYLMREAANLVSGFELQAAVITKAVERMKDGAAAAAKEATRKAESDDHADRLAGAINDICDAAEASVGAPPEGAPMPPP